MKKTAILLVLAILSFGFGMAQNTAMRADNIEQRVETEAQILKTQLLLSSEQYAKVYEVIKTNIKKLNLLKADMKTMQGEEAQNYRKKLLQKNNLEYEKEMKSILNSKQFKKWKKNRDKKKKAAEKNDSKMIF